LKFKRILATAFALALTLPLLISWAQAHPGRTDSSGGHTDSDTGDYHYHHGYEAHAHFDIDGNGTIDCPYDFDDQTGRNSGTSTGSGSYTPGDGSEDGYQEGYANGYKKGEDDGYDDGYRKATAEHEKTIAEVKAEHDKTIRELGSQHRSELEGLRTLAINISVPLAIALVLCALLLRSSIRKCSSNEADFRHTIDKLKADCLKEKQSMTTAHEAEIAKLKKRYESSAEFSQTSHTRQLMQQKSSYEARIAELTRQYESSKVSLVADQTRRISQEKEALAVEVALLKKMLKANRRLSILDRISAGEDPEITLPPDIWLKQSFTPIKGKASERYPYGEFTVFLSPLGTKYHCRHDCITSGRPLHFFDLSSDAQPCSRCVNPKMYPKPRPTWYGQIRQRLDREFDQQQTTAAAHLCLDTPNSEDDSNLPF
jgi:hypothetical protein